jgi:Fe-S-cluster containining protein
VRDGALGAKLLAQELQALYEQVPATACAHSGECCALTPDEVAQGYATMFPLYRAEYANVSDYLEGAADQRRREELLAVTEERPVRCPFLGPERTCTIYPVRPLICRTYAVMSPNTIAAAATRHEGQVPHAWIRGFVRREGGMLCPRVRVLEAHKLERHAHHLITGAYEQTLVSLSCRVEPAPAERQRLYRQGTGQDHWPVRWSWGGFNALCRTSLEWMREQLPVYWRGARFVDLD